MTSESKLKLGRINKATLARIRDLRKVLAFIKENPGVTKEDIHSVHKWSPSKCSKIVLNLMTCELVRVSGTTKGKDARKKYSVTAYTEADLNRELPLDLEISHTSGRPETPKSAEPVKEWEPCNVRRDPLVAYLMGSGIAPSVIFHRSQHASS
jgi:hypothetical protein